MNRERPLAYVRTQRRRWALTQKELGYLIGIEGRIGIARIEQGERLPTIETALALEVLFGTPPRTMFPRFYAEIEETVMQRALLLHEGLIQGTSPAEKRKCELLKQALARATKSDNTQPV